MLRGMLLRFLYGIQRLQERDAALKSGWHKTQLGSGGAIKTQWVQGRTPWKLTVLLQLTIGVEYSNFVRSSYTPSLKMTNNLFSPKQL